LHSKANRLLLFFCGGLTSLYAIYDLGDFFRGDITETDAGIISKYYFQNSETQIWSSYLIGILISILSIWIMYRIIIHAFHVSQNIKNQENLPIPEIPQPGAEDEMLLKMQLLESMTPETMQFLMHINQSKQEGKTGDP
jgi:hypothetical protein